jgi:hypothetical protein
VPASLRDELVKLAEEGNRPLAREAKAALEEHIRRHRRGR